MNKAFACICLSLGSAFVVQTMLLVAVPLEAIALGATPLMLGLIVSAPYVLPLLLALPFGSLVARLGSPRTLQIGAVAMVIGAGLLAVQPLLGIGINVIAVTAALGARAAQPNQVMDPGHPK